MHIKKINRHPFTLISKIRNMENKLVNAPMISMMHDSSTMTEQVKTLIVLLDISRKYSLLGYTAKAVRTYLRVVSIYERVIKKYLDH